MNEQDYLARARTSLLDAEKEAQFHPDRSEAYVGIANGWMRLAEHSRQVAFLRAFQEKRFN
jgi:hypothetical protein